MLFVGDDWAEDHHDVEVQDETGRRLAKARLPEGISGIARLHALVGRFLPEDSDPAEVKIGIETDRGPWVAALVASGYQVYAINPLQSARARQGQDVSGAKSDAGDAHVLADLVRTHSHQLRTVAGDSKEAGAVKVLTRMHQSLIWDRTRQVLRLRSSLREFFAAAFTHRDARYGDSTASLTAGSGRLRTCGQPRALCRRTVPRRRRRTHHPWGRLPRGEQGIGTRRGRAQPVPLCLRVPGTLNRTKSYRASGRSSRSTAARRPGLLPDRRMNCRQRRFTGKYSVERAIRGWRGGSPTPRP